MQKWTMADIKAANKAAGKFFFERDTMRFFKSRACRAVYQGPGGVFFVTSEQGPTADDKRRYTVRQFNPDTGEVDTAGEFQAFAAEHAARAEARRLANPAAFIPDTEPDGDEPLETAEEASISAMSAEGMAPTYSRIILGAAAAYQRMAEVECGRDLTDDERMAERRAENTIRRVIKEMQLGVDPGFGVVFCGDPRGACVKIKVPSGRTDDWGQTGICVPTR